MRLPVPRLQDGSPDDRAEELEETETNPLADWLAYHEQEGDIEYMGTVDGIARYRIIAEGWPE